MRQLSIWLDAHCSRGDMGVFRSAAELATSTTIAPAVERVSNGHELLDVLRMQDRHSIDHVVIAGHGGTTWILDDEHGVTTGRPKHPDQVHIVSLAGSLANIMVSDGLVSLAACLCSRSPRWFLNWKFGRRVGSDWGMRAYQPGGEASFSARLRDYMYWHGRAVRVRGHRAAGHATALALLAEHRSNGVDGPGLPCVPLFKLALPEAQPTLYTRRWWVRTVTGSLAQRWLMGDDDVVGEIADLWRAAL